MHRVLARKWEVRKAKGIQENVSAAFDDEQSTYAGIQATKGKSDGSEAVYVAQPDVVERLKEDCGRGAHGHDIGMSQETVRNAEGKPSEETLTTDWPPFVAS